MSEHSEDIEIVGGTYLLEEVLGEGSYGLVRKGKHLFTQQEVAIKMVHEKTVTSKKEKMQLNREVEILKVLDHPNIVSLLDIVRDDDITYLVFEYVSGGELFDYIMNNGRLEEIEARRLIRQMVSAIEYCHCLLIVHRDLKPENILLDENLNVKISDFGLSNVIVPGKYFDTFCGSLLYASPEILKGETYIGPGIDIWSLGIILYCLVIGHQPWDASSPGDLIDTITNKGISIPKHISDDCVDLMMSMLRVGETDRISLAGIREHPWINKGYEEPPVSYLPEPQSVDKIDTDVIKKLKKIGFKDADSTESLQELIECQKTQFVSTYHLLKTAKKKKFNLFDQKKKKTIWSYSYDGSAFEEGSSTAENEEESVRSKSQRQSTDQRVLIKTPKWLKKKKTKKLSNSDYISNVGQSNSVGSIDLGLTFPKNINIGDRPSSARPVVSLNKPKPITILGSPPGKRQRSRTVSKKRSKRSLNGLFTSSLDYSANSSDFNSLDYN